MTQERKPELRVHAPEHLRAGLVTIGLPVYNGARYLREALDSLVAQDYPDFEIIISDNASTDETEAICREFAARDKRVRYHRSAQNRGPLWNSVRVYEMARGEFFMWAAHDDLRHPQYLSRCVAALKNEPRALFCCTEVRLIDEAGRDISDSFTLQSYLPTGASPRERLLALLRSTVWLHSYSLTRTSALAQTRLGTYMWGGDVVQTAEMCLRGEVVAVREKLFDYRWFHAKTADDLAQSISTGDASVSVSWSDLAAELIESVRRSPLGFVEKLRLKWMIVVELCFRNPNVGWGIREEGFKPTRRAVAEGKYRRAITLAFIAVLKQTIGFVERVTNSMRHRAAKLRGALFSGDRAASGRGKVTEEHRN